MSAALDRLHGIYLTAGRVRGEPDTPAVIARRRAELLGHAAEPPLPPVIAWRRAVLEAADAGAPEPPRPRRRRRSRRAGS